MNFRTPSLLLKLNTFVRRLMEPPPPPPFPPPLYPHGKEMGFLKPIIKWLNPYGVDCYGSSMIRPEAIFPKTVGVAGSENTGDYKPPEIWQNMSKPNCRSMAEFCQQYIVGWEMEVKMIYLDSDREYVGEGRYKYERVPWMQPDTRDYYWKQNLHPVLHKDIIAASIEPWKAPYGL